MTKLTSLVLAIAMFTSINITTIGRVFVIVPITSLVIEKNAYANSDKENQTINSRINKKMWIAKLLALCSLHHFYLNNTLTGIAYIAITAFFGVGWFLSIGDLFIMMNMSDQEWQNYLKSDKSLLW